MDSSKNKIACTVASCIYNIDGCKCKRSGIEVVDCGEEKCEPFCNSYEKYCGFGKN